MFSEAPFIFKFEFIASVVRSFTYTFRVYLFSYPESLLHFGRSASLLTHHVASLLSCRVTLRFRRIPLVAFSVRYVLNTFRDWPDTFGLIHTASRAKPNRSKSNRSVSAWKTNLLYEMETFTLHAEPSLTERVHWLVFVSHRALIKCRPATLFYASICTRISE